MPDVRELLEMVEVVVVVVEVVVVVVVVLLGWSAAGVSSAAAVTKCINDKAELTIINSGFILYYYLLFSLALLPSAGYGLWLSRSRGFLITHNDTPQSVGFLWMSDQLVTETSI
jgi:hypothetical protein